MRVLWAAVLVALGASAAIAQEPEPPGGPGLRAGNIRSSGQTVPNPATLPNAQRSAVDRPIQSDDKGKTDYGICKGC